MKRKYTALMLAAVILLSLPLTSCRGKKEISSDPNSSQATPVSSDSSTSSDSAESNDGSSSQQGASSAAGSSAGHSSTSSGGSSGQQNNPKKIVVSIAEYEDGNNDYEAIYLAVEDIKLKASAATIKGENVSYTLKLRKKNYNIDGTLELLGCSNFTIDGAGATIVMTKKQAALNIKSCKNLTISNLSIDYNPLWFTQGTITAVSGNNLTLKIDAGYRDDYENFITKQYSVMRLHDAKTGGHLAGATTDYEIKAIRRTASGTLVATMSIPYTGDSEYRPQAGNRFSLYECSGGAVMMTDCTNTTYNAFNIYGSMGFGIHEISGPGGTVMKNCKIVPGPKPAGAKAARMLSTLGDATHFQSVNKGPTLDGCTITHCCDDGINVHGFFYRVVRVSGKDITVAFLNDDPWAAGDTVNVFDRNEYNCRGSAKIVKLEKIRDVSLSTDDGILTGNTKYVKGWYYKITLDKAIPGISVGDDMSDPSRMGSGATVKNSTFGYNRARGIVLKGENSVIENNTITGTSHAGIMVISELSWAEGGFSNNSVIRNNKVINCGFDSRVEYGTGTVGGIMVLLSPKNKSFYKSTAARNLVIENNTVNNTVAFGIFISNCDGVTVRGNKVINPFARGINNIGNVYGVTPKSGILIGMSKNITAVNNSVQCRTDGITKSVDILNNCSSVKSNSGNNFSK